MHYRTSNKVEGWHNRVNWNFGGAHPGFWRFLLALKDEVVSQDILILERFVGNPTPPKNKVYFRLDLLIRVLMTELAVRAPDF